MPTIYHAKEKSLRSIHGIIVYDPSDTSKRISGIWRRDVSVSCTEAAAPKKWRWQFLDLSTSSCTRHGRRKRQSNSRRGTTTRRQSDIFYFGARRAKPALSVCFTSWKTFTATKSMSTARDTKPRQFLFWNVCGKQASPESTAFPGAPRRTRCAEAVCRAGIEWEA